MSCNDKLYRELEDNMSYNDKLYRELEDLRERLKEIGKRKTGKAPVICSDEVLYKIVNWRPQKKEDFRSIYGIGEAFVDNYADEFLKVIKKYNAGAENENIEIGPKIIEVLKELEKRLVNINRRNRLLYMPKATSKYAVDVYGGFVNPLDVIFGKNSKIKICDTESACPVLFRKADAIQLQD